MKWKLIAGIVVVAMAAIVAAEVALDKFDFDDRLTGGK